MKQLQLRYQITLATFVPLIIFGLLSAGVGAYALQKIPQDLVLQRQRDLAQVAAAGVAGELKGHLRLLEVTATELSKHIEDPGVQQQIITERTDLLSDFSGGVLLLDTQGTAIATTASAHASRGLNFEFRDYFQQVKTQQVPVFSTIFQDHPTGQDAVVIAVPMHRNGIFAGVLLGEFTLDDYTWTQNLNLLRTPQGGKAYLIDNASAIIYHPDTEQIGKMVQSDPALWRLIIAGQPNSIIYQPAKTDQRIAAAFAPIPGVAWGVIMEEPWDTIIAPLLPYQWAAAGLLVLGFVLALIMLLLSIKHITRPLNALLTEAQQISAGEPFHPLTPEGPPDLRTLTEAFNQMIIRLEEQQETLRNYAHQIVQSQEEERKRISRDLHDETIQDLVGLIQRLELYSNELQKDSTAAQKRFNEIQSLAHSTLKAVRRMSNHLRPFILEDLGLPAALEVLSKDLAQALPEAHIHYELVGKERRINQEVELTAFRIAQEALNNIRKHAPQAKRINITLFFEMWGILIMIEDDGRGFQAADLQTLLREGHLGLTGMFERARLFGGDLHITSSPGEGTSISLRFPLEAQTKQSQAVL